MVIDLTEALHVPLRDRNAVLLAAGHAPRYAEAGLEAPVMARVTAALRRMLQQNEPFPAVVMDRHWNVVLANDAAPRFFGCFVDLSSRPRPRNLLHLLLDPAGLRPFVVDWPATARMLRARIYREAPGHAIDPEIRQFLDHLGHDAKGGAPELDPASPLIPLTFAKDGTTLSYFSLVTTVGAPQGVAAEELRLECMIPADAETESDSMEISCCGMRIRATAGRLGRSAAPSRGSFDPGSASETPWIWSARRPRLPYRKAGQVFRCRS